MLMYHLISLLFLSLLVSVIICVMLLRLMPTPMQKNCSSEKHFHDFTPGHVNSVEINANSNKIETENREPTKDMGNQLFFGVPLSKTSPKSQGGARPKKGKSSIPTKM